MYLTAVQITIIITYMKKLLNSNWLRAMQFKCNTSAKSVHRSKLHIVILDYDWLKDKRKVSKPMISHKMMTKILCGNYEKIPLK